MLPEVLDLNAIVRDMERLLRPVIGEHLELRSLLEPNLGHVKADRGQIEQVIMNLVVNSRDAMPGGGSLTIETRNVELDEAFGRVNAAIQPGPLRHAGGERHGRRYGRGDVSPGSLSHSSPPRRRARGRGSVCRRSTHRHAERRRHLCRQRARLRDDVQDLPAACSGAALSEVRTAAEPENGPRRSRDGADRRGQRRSPAC